MTDLVNIDAEKTAALDLVKKAAQERTGLKGNTALAKAIADTANAKSVTPQAISQWTEVPLGRVFDVERATGVPRHIQRPDFFDAPEQDSAA